MNCSAVIIIAFLAQRGGPAIGPKCPSTKKRRSANESGRTVSVRHATAEWPGGTCPKKPGPIPLDILLPPGVDRARPVCSLRRLGLKAGVTRGAWEPPFAPG